MMAEKAPELMSLPYRQRLYESPSRLIRWHHNAHIRHAVAAGELGEGHRILDLGCADGPLLPFLRGRIRGLVALDVVKVYLDRAAEFARAEDVGPCAFVQGVAERLPLPSASVDRVFCLETLEHCEDQAKAVTEIRRVLSPGGLAVVSVPVEIGPPLLVKHGLRRLLGYPMEPWTFRELMQAGFCRSVRGIPHQRKHRGFDYRNVVRLFRDVFGRVTVRYSPLHWLGPLFNAQAVIVARASGGGT